MIMRLAPEATPEAEGTLLIIDGITGIPWSFPATLPEGNNFLVEDVDG